jgi:hypothetical protein
MIAILTLFTVINTILMVVAGCIYFKKHYVVMTVDEFNEVAEAVADYHKLLEEGQELAGGVGEVIPSGFFREYLEEPDEEDDE